MTRYGMLINTKKCVGCYACRMACQMINKLEPEEAFISYKEIEQGTYPSVYAETVPVQCMHCENAPCQQVCPTHATYTTDSGVVLVDEEKCIGCKSCMEACPYGARYLVQSEDGYFGSELNEYESVAYENMPKMTVDKCDFCIEHSGDGKPEPVCVKACMAEARLFGDLDEMKKLVAERGGEAYLPEEGTEPRVFYLPTITA